MSQSCSVIRKRKSDLLLQQAAIPMHLQGYEDQAINFTRAMTELAQILRRISEGIYHPHAASDKEKKILTAMHLDADLDQLQNDVVLAFNLNDISLTESETTTKRKVILKLRKSNLISSLHPDWSAHHFSDTGFYRARILLHRQTLLAAAACRGTPHYDQSARICIEAAEQTIRLLYDTYLHRPYFRSWWDNTVHAFDATCILLFATISGIQGRDPAPLLDTIRQSCQIFDAMRTEFVAQRCAEFARDLLYIAETALQEGPDRMRGSVAMQPMPEQRIGGETPTSMFSTTDFQPLANPELWSDDLLAVLTASGSMEILDSGFDTIFGINEVGTFDNILQFG